MPEIKWIKINTDIFDDEKIGVIEKMPEGDTMLIVWLKLLTLAGKKNDHGQIYFTQSIPYTIEMLADIFRRDSRLVSLALNTFVSFDMISIVEDRISILNWEKHQNVEGMDKIREQTRLRVSKYRQQKALPPCNATVTLRNATEEDKNRIDKEVDKNKKKEPKHKHGEYKNILLSDIEYKKLSDDWGKEELERMIVLIDEGIELKGYKYKNHNLAIRKWKAKEADSKPPEHDYVAESFRKLKEGII
jgi:predicted phage replisome organizer